jgi:hypothetical protein
MSRHQHTAARNSFRPQMEVLEGRALLSGQGVQQAFVSASDLGLDKPHQVVRQAHVTASDLGLDKPHQIAQSPATQQGMTAAQQQAHGNASDEYFVATTLESYHV